MNKDIIIGVLLLIIGVFIYAVFFSNDIEVMESKITELKTRNEALKKDIDKQKLITDSLVLVNTELLIKWENRDKNIVQTIKNKYNDKINILRVLSPDSTVLLLSEWLSKITTIRE